MEKLQKSKFVLLVGVLGVALALCAFAISGCSGGGQSNADLQKNFQGTWKMCELTEGDQVYSESDMAMLESLAGTCSLTLNEDKTGKFEYFGQSQDGTWEVKDASTATLKFGADSTECTLKDGKLTISVDSASLTFKKSS